MRQPEAIVYHYPLLILIDCDTIIGALLAVEIVYTIAYEEKGKHSSR